MSNKGSGHLTNEGGRGVSNKGSGHLTNEGGRRCVK